MNVPRLGFLVILLATIASIVYELNPNASQYLYLTGGRGSTCTTRNEWIWISISSFLLSLTPALERCHIHFNSSNHVPLLSGSQVFHIFMVLQVAWISSAMYPAFSEERDDNDDEYFALFQWFQLLGTRAAWPGLWNLAILIFPLQRTSSLLRHLGVSHRDALCFHQWAGHAVLFWLATHTVILSLVYAVNHPSIKEWLLLMLPYKNLYTEGVVNFTGCVGFLALLILWLFSLPSVQKNSFELFFVFHLGLAPIFILFSTLHDYATLFFVQPAFVAWVTDRILRRYSSDKNCRVMITTMGHVTNLPSSVPTPRDGSFGGYGEGRLSTVLGSSVVQVTLPIPSTWGGGRLKPGTYINLKDFSLSSWQSHPFSVQPCGTESMTINIKALGDWSNAFVKNVQEFIQEHQHPKGGSSNYNFQGTNGLMSNLEIEGPYVSTLCHVIENHQRCYFIAGGIGITGVVDLCQLCHDSGRPYDLVWLVRTPHELAMLEPLLTPLTEDSNTMSQIKIFVTSNPSTSEATIPVLSTKCHVSYGSTRGASSLFGDQLGPTELSSVIGAVLSLAISFLISRLVACSYKSGEHEEQARVRTCTLLTNSVTCVPCEANAEEHHSSYPCCTVGICYYAFRVIPVLLMFLGVPLLTIILLKGYSEVRKRLRWYDYHTASTVEMEDNPRGMTATTEVPFSSPSLGFTPPSSLTIRLNDYRHGSNSIKHGIQVEYQKPNLKEVLASIVVVDREEESDEKVALVVCGSHSLVFDVLRLGRQLDWTHVKILPIHGLPEVGVGL
jgi:hypothetical protein